MGRKESNQTNKQNQSSEVGIEPGLLDSKANILPRRRKSQLLPQGNRSVLYTYPHYTIILLKKIELVVLHLIVFVLSCGCLCSVALTSGAGGSSVVCDCGNF